jgi:hypothetical protein
MNNAQVEYAALRFESTKTISSIAASVKSGRVLVEQVNVEKLGKKVRKFRCPPGTRRAGKWTNSMGTTCQMGPPRAALAKLGSGIEKLGDAVQASDKRKRRGGPGLVRFEAGRAVERAGEIVDYLGDKRKEKKAKKVKKTTLLGGKLTGAADKLATEAEIAAAKKKKISKRNAIDKFFINGGGDALNDPGDGLEKLYKRWEDRKKSLLDEKNRPSGISDEDWTDYKDFINAVDPEGSKAISTLPNFADWEKANKAPNASEGPKTPKTPKASKPKAPKTPKPVKDENLPDFEMPSLVPKDDIVSKRQASIDKVKKDFADRKAELLANRPDGLTDEEWKSYTDFIKSQEPKFGFGGADTIPDLPEYNKWGGKTEGNLPTPTTVEIPGKKPKKPKKPTGPAKASEANIDVAATSNEKNVGKKVTNKKLPGKQYGGVFKNEEECKKYALPVAMDRGEAVYVTKTENGKFRLVNEERFLASGEEAVLAIGPDGSVIDLPDKKADRDEIVKDVEIAVEEAVQEAEKEVIELAKTADSFELTKSKTGQFLPDNLSPEVLDNHRDGASLDFINAFMKERDAVNEFWFKRLGDDAANAQTFDEFVNLINAAIKKEQDKDSPNKKLLGVLLTERKNFLAMNAPDQGDEDGMLDPTQRFNFIQPKRRANIIEDAALSGLVVGKKDIKPKTVDLDPNADVTPEVPDVTPDVPKISTDEIDPINTYEAVGKIDALNGQWYMDITVATNERMDKDFPAEFAALQKQHSDPDHMEDLNDAANKKKVDALHKELDAQKALRNHMTSGGDAETRKKLEEDYKQAIIDSNYASVFYERVSDHVYEAEQKKLADDLNDPVDIHVDPDEEINKSLLAAAKKDAEKHLESVLADTDWVEAEKAQYGVDFESSLTGPQSIFDWKNMESVDAINAAFDTLIKDQDEIAKSFDEKVKKAIDEGETSPYGDIAKAYIYPEVQKKIIEAKRQEIIDAFNKKAQGPSEPIKVDVKKSGVEASFTHVFDSAKNFDYSKLDSAETAKLGTGLQGIINRQTAKTQYTKDIDEAVAKLPDNFGELSPEEQIQAILQATGKTDSLEAAKVLARSAVVNKYGRKETLTQLNDAMNLHKGGADNAAFDSVLDAMGFTSLNKAKDELLDESIKAHQDLASLPDGVNPAVRDIYIGRLNDVKAKRLTLNIIAYNKSKNTPQGTSPNNVFVAAAGKDLYGSLDVMDERLKGDISTILDNGLVIKNGNPSGKAASKMIKVSDYDSSILGTVQEDGKAIAHSIPLGYRGIWEQSAADTHLAEGKKLSEIPDEFLKEAIWANTGPGKRFAVINDGSIKGGFNDMGQDIKDQTTGFVDTVTGKKYVIKTAHRNEQEHTQEVAGALFAQILGEPTTGIRYGSGIIQKPLPPEKATIEGKKLGDQRAIVMEHVGNLFAGDGYEILPSIPSTSSSNIDPESLARLMVLDRSMNYFDRTSTNLVAVKGPDGKIHLHPIDHGNGFYPFASGKNEANYGLIKPSKPENINLINYASSMSAEDKTKFAAALRDAVRRYKKADYKTEFTALADTMKVSDGERERLMKHADFLEKRKESLNWDKMSVDALVNIGFTTEEANDLLAGGAEIKGFALPPDTPTLATSGPAISKLPTKMSAGKTMLYDGGSIEGFSVVGQEIKTTGTFKGESLPSVSTQLVFKVRGDTLDKIKAGENGWEYWQGGHLYPSGGTTMITKIDFDSPKTDVPGGSNAGMVTKRLDDGTIIVATIGGGNWNGTVRVLIPGKADTALSDQQKITKIMFEVGIEDHGLPTAEQVRDLGIRRAAAHLLGIKNIQDYDIDSLIAKLDAKGISPEDIVLNYDTTGTPNVRLTPEATQKVIAKTGIKELRHNMGYGTSSSSYDKALVGIFTSGHMASTNRRYNSGIGISGASSGQDVNVNGSDYVFFHPSTSATSSPSEYSFYVLPELSLNRVDSLVTPGDAYGNPNYRSGLITDSTPLQYMLTSEVPVSTGIFVLSAGKRQELLNKLSSNGISEIDGVPLELLISTQADYKKSRDALIQIWQERGLIA